MFSSWALRCLGYLEYPGVSRASAAQGSQCENTEKTRGFRRGRACEATVRSKPWLRGAFEATVRSKASFSRPLHARKHRSRVPSRPLGVPSRPLGARKHCFMVPSRLPFARKRCSRGSSRPLCARNRCPGVAWSRQSARNHCSEFAWSAVGSPLEITNEVTLRSHVSVPLYSVALHPAPALLRACICTGTH